MKFELVSYEHGKSLQSDGMLITFSWGGVVIALKPDSIYLTMTMNDHCALMGP